jgi:transposase
MDIDSLIGADDPARTIWAYVEGLHLRQLEDAIKSREGTPGHPTISPQLLLALWLFATSQGVGSARALARLCDSHDAYRWLCGGVSVNYHTLADFRVDHIELLDRLLAENVAALAQAGTVDLSTLARRTGCGCGRTREPPRSDAIRHCRSIWQRPVRWWSSSSASWKRITALAIGASKRRKSGQRASALSGSRRRGNPNFTARANGQLQRVPIIMVHSQNV